MKCLKCCEPVEYADKAGHCLLCSREPIPKMAPMKVPFTVKESTKCISCFNPTERVDSDGNCLFCSSFAVTTGKEIQVPFFSLFTEKITVTSCGGDDCEVGLPWHSSPSKPIPDDWASTLNNAAIPGPTQHPDPWDSVPQTWDGNLYRQSLHTDPKPLTKPIKSDQVNMKCIRCNSTQPLNKDRICHHCWDILLHERGVEPTKSNLTDFPDTTPEELTAKVAPSDRNFTHPQRFLMRIFAIIGFYLSGLAAITNPHGWPFGLIVAIMSGIMWEIGRDAKDG